MSDVKIYEVHMKLCGRLTQLPDSQKIFGALVYLYANYEGENAASELVKSILCSEAQTHIHVALSDMLPEGYISTPQAYLMEKLSTEEHVDASPSQSKQESTAAAKNEPALSKGKAFYKAVKKRTYIQREDWEEFDRMKNIDELYPYVEIQQSQQIHAAVDSLRYDCPGLEPNLYSVPDISILKVEKEEVKEESGQKREEPNEIKTPMNEFYFYLEADACTAEEMKGILEKAKEEQRPLFLGPRVSQGLNLYLVQDIEEANALNERKHPTEKTQLGNTLSQTGEQLYLNMGMLLPNQLELSSSYLSLFISERHPYCPDGGWDSTQPSQYISFIQAGSVLCTCDWKKAGQSIPSPYEKRSIVFGNGFLYPMRGRRNGKGEKV